MAQALAEYSFSPLKMFPGSFDATIHESHLYFGGPQGARFLVY